MGCSTSKQVKYENVKELPPRDVSYDTAEKTIEPGNNKHIRTDTSATIIPSTSFDGKTDQLSDSKTNATNHASPQEETSLVEPHTIEEQNSTTPTTHESPSQYDVQEDSIAPLPATQVDNWDTEVPSVQNKDTSDVSSGQKSHETENDIYTQVLKQIHVEKVKSTISFDHTLNILQNNYEEDKSDWSAPTMNPIISNVEDEADFSPVTETRATVTLGSDEETNASDLGEDRLAYTTTTDPEFRKTNKYDCLDLLPKRVPIIESIKSYNLRSTFNWPFIHCLACPGQEKQQTASAHLLL